MSIKALQDYTYYSKYARYNKGARRRETWNEAVDRVRDMHLTKYAAQLAKHPEVREQVEWAFEIVRQKRVLGSQRALQFGGTPILKKNARIYNCTVSYCDRLRFFQEAFWLLLCGCGVGFSVQKHHVGRLPEFIELPVKANGQIAWKTAKTYQIADSIEGWADALGVLLASYFPSEEFPDFAGCDVEFDFRLIRPAGAYLSSGSGKAPGPDPLRRSLEVIRQLLNRCVVNGQRRLRPIDAYDIVMHASDAVLSGGVRRSATICLFSPDDDEMATAKTGNWFNENPQRGRSNNSALLLRDKTSKEQFLKLMNSVKEFGEPGFVWSDSTEYVVNPCVEIGMYPVWQETGETGWQFCNLCEQNGRKIKSREDWEKAARAGAIIGTLQAGYDEFDYLGEVSRKIVQKEALLGVSITGMMDNPEILFDAGLQREMAELILRVNEELAPKLGINPCARATCVKPAGTTSCVLGTGSGIHPHHAKRYFRRVQGNTLEAPLQYFKAHNPEAVERSVWSVNGTDEVITFCIEVPDGAKTKNDLDAVKLLEHVKLTQQNWVSYGRRQDRCTAKWLTHNVSNTINVRPEEWDAVADYIYENRKYFAGISLLPITGDLDYPQAPMCAIHTAREIVALYGEGSLFASGLIVDGLRAFQNNLWEACNCALGLGPLEAPSEPQSMKDDQVLVAYLEAQELFDQKVQWVERVKHFAQKYTNGDVRRTTYLLKEVSNWHQWCNLTRVFKDVDYTNMFEATDETKPMETVACAGGACSLV